MTKLYAAGAEYKITDGLTEFKFVRPSGAEKPYITKNPNGLRETMHHAGLYEIDMTSETATLIRESENPDVTCPKSIRLTQKIICELKHGVEV